MTVTQGLEPTQVRRPWRAVARTVLAVAVPLFLALPFIIQAIVDELGETLPPAFTAWLLGAAAVCTALAAVITRILALPQVELILRSLPGAPFAAQPRPKPDEPQPILGKAIAGDLPPTTETPGGMRARDRDDGIAG